MDQIKVIIDYQMEKLGEGAEDVLTLRLDEDAAAKILADVRYGLSNHIETKVMANVIREIAVLRGYNTGHIVRMERA